MKFPLQRTPQRGNRLARQLRVEELESRQLLAVVLNLPTEPVPAWEGSAVTVQVDATGAGTLSYSLTSNSPPDATIDAQGVIQWTPSDGPATATVEVSVTDSDGTVTGSFSVAVQNVPPDASIVGPSAGVRGQPLTYQITATDPSTADMAAGLSVVVDWGDGSPMESFAVDSSTPQPLALVHDFVASNSYSVTVTAKDKDGGSDTTTQIVSITAVALQDDPVLGGKMLVVGGTSGNDQIVLNPSHGVKVLLNGKSQGSFAPTSRVVVYGQDGNDNIQVAGGVRLPAWLYGGAGNDRLKGGNGHDFLFGGEGLDNLLGGQGNDLLVGDVGADRLGGEAGNDILVAGSIGATLTESAIKGLVDTWSASSKSATDAANLKTGLGVTDDNDVDQLTGAAGVDCFFYQAGVDVATDLDVLASTKPNPKPKKK